MMKYENTHINEMFISICSSQVKSTVNMSYKNKAFMVTVLRLIWCLVPTYICCNALPTGALFPIQNHSQCFN